MGGGVGDFYGAGEGLPAPGVAVGDGERGGVWGEFVGESGEGDVVAFDGEPAADLAAFWGAVGVSADAEDGGEPFGEGAVKLAVGVVEQLGGALFFRFEEEGLFDGAHPRFFAHLVGDGGEIDGIDAAFWVPSGLTRELGGGAAGVGLDEESEALEVALSFDEGSGMTPFFGTALEGVEEAGGAAGDAVGVALVDRFGLQMGCGEPVGLADGGKGDQEDGEQSKDHCLMMGG